MSNTTETTFDRDQFARWYAKRHMETDTGVRQIYYLPKNAASREIRFLEVNDLISELAEPEPIDFGVDIGGADAHTLLVLDVTPGQWEAIQKGQLALPNGWSRDGSELLASRR